MAAVATLAVGSSPLSAAAVSQSSDRKRTLQRVLNPLLIAGGIVILLLTLFVVIYPLVSPYNPRDPDFLQPVGGVFRGEAALDASLRIGERRGDRMPAVEPEQGRIIPGP